MLIWINTPRAQGSRFLFLDRDGVINEDRPDYVKSRQEYRFYPDSLDALRLLHAQDIQVIVISNQSGLNRGIISWEDFRDIHQTMVRGIQEAGGSLLGAIYCPHRPDENCSCRKPLPGMIRAACKLYRIPLQATWLIGDKATDMMAADQAGCRGILLRRSPPVPESLQTTHKDLNVLPECSARQHSTLLEAVLEICRQAK